MCYIKDKAAQNQSQTKGDRKRNKDKLHSKRLRQRENRERKEGYEDGEEKVVLRGQKLRLRGTTIFICCQWLDNNRNLASLVF